MERRAALKRITNETTIDASVDLSGGAYSINTGIGFFDHMLAGFAKHSGFGMTVQAVGDLNVDTHHTVEDTGIVIGTLLKEAAGSREGIRRYGHSVIPMDEALIDVAIDFGGRAYFVMLGDIPNIKLGDFETETVKEFFYALAYNSGMNLHIRILYGSNTHHIIEGIFKAVAHSLKEALSYDPDLKGVLSTKGVLI